MSPATLLVFALVAALGALMGFRDAPNAVALPVRFRALAPRMALLTTALLNGVGVLLGMGLISLGISLISEMAHPPHASLLTAVVSILIALAWGVLLWWRRIPGSTTHALLAAIGGVHLASALLLGTPLAPQDGHQLWIQLVVGLLLSPVLAWGLTRLITPHVVRLGTRGTTVTVQHRARIALAVSAGTTALGHGVQTGQRLGILWALAAIGTGLAQGVPPEADTLLTAENTGLATTFWASAAVFALAVALGTLGGAWRIAWTLTERLVHLDPLRAAVAGAVPATMLFLGGLALDVPLSSTHTVTAGIVGAGQTQTYASVRWPQVLLVAGWWVLTPLVCGGIAFASAAAAIRLGLL